jgi:DNA polymerase-3 subunit beta
MKFSANKKVFLDQLKKVASVSTASDINPIYENLLIECESDKINIYAINEILAIKAIVDKDIKVESTGKCMVNANIFSRIIDKISDNEFTIETISDSLLKITSGYFTSNINLFKHEDTMNFDFEEIGNKNTIPFSYFKEINDKLIKIIPPTKIMQTSPFRGILFDSTRNPNTLETVATDTYHLGCINKSFDGEQFKIIVSPEIIKTIYSHNRNNVDLSLFIKNNRILIVADNTFYNCSLIEGAYPSASKIIEAPYDFNFTINKNKLINAIDKAIIISDDSAAPIVSLTIRSHLINISGYDVEKGNSSEDIEITSNINEDTIKIVLNSSNLLSLIKNIDSQEVLFKLNGSFKPIIINDANNTDYTSLILPIKRS